MPSGRVIQGFFIGGAMRSSPAPRPAPGDPAPRHPTGAPPPAFAGRAAPLQARMAPGRPPLVRQGVGRVQPQGNGSFGIDPVQLGLARGGGKPLPQAVLAKMEAAFGADFSSVRVHVGPQASRIGAIAFATGDDLYFGPGHFRPDSARGLQLIGHELAHVTQQRQGRVRAPSSGLAVVQDPALEAEADRLGMRAAMMPARPRAAPSRPFRGGLAPLQRSRSIQRAEMSVSDRDEADDLREAIRRSLDRNSQQKAKPARPREIFTSQQQNSYGYGASSIDYDGLEGSFHKGWGGQPFMHGGKTDYDAVIQKLTQKHEGFDEAKVAATIMGVIDHGAGVLKYLPEALQEPAWQLIKLTQLIESHSSRFPGADKWARALLGAIAGHKATFKQCFNRKDGLFLPAWNKKAGALCGGQQAMRIYMDRERLASDNTSITYEEIKKIIQRLPEILSGGLSDSSDDDSS